MHYPESALEMGINAPKAHQRIISKLTTGLGHLYYHQHEIDLEPLPVTQIDEGPASRYDGPPVPDIMLHDNETFRTPVIIEVCHPNGLNNDLKKVIRLIEEDDYGIEEGFIYDYVRGLWSKYQKGIGWVYSDVSYSNILSMDLAALL